MAFTLHDLGRNIQKLRLSKPSSIKHGKSMLQYELAGRAGIPSSSLCNIEKGKYANPTWEILSKIASGLDSDIAEFFVKRKEDESASQIALNEMIDMIIRERLENLLAEKQK
jgi:transcriptional regulator with XRE-family HTH domain